MPSKFLLTNLFLTNINKNQTNLAKGGIIDQCWHLVNHKSSLYTSWKQIPVLDKVWPPNLHFSRVGDPKSEPDPSNGLNSDANVMDDRRQYGKHVEIG